VCVLFRINLEKVAKLCNDIQMHLPLYVYLHLYIKFFITQQCSLHKTSADI